MGIEALYRRPRTSIPARDAKIYPYLLDGLAIERPNQVWASDFTYLPMAHRFLYLVAILDVASRKVLSFRVSNTMRPDFCVDALRRGENVVALGDGTFGLLPETWMKQYGLLAALGTAHEGHLLFVRSQIGVLDALLAAQPEAQCDALFAQARDELRIFAGIRATDPPAGFHGELRPYQKEGRGWMNFLNQFGFGSCLADDMGLGKTVQVLALLEALRASRHQRNGSGPSLVVVPNSLIFNWILEAQAIDRAHRIGQANRVFAYRASPAIRSRRRCCSCRMRNAN